MAGFRPGEFTPNRQTFIVSLKVKNPTDRTLPINGATYALELEGHEIANGSGDLDRQIPAFGEEVVDVEVNTQLAVGPRPEGAGTGPYRRRQMGLPNLGYPQARRRLLARAAQLW